jgi:hypothetical protein
MASGFTREGCEPAEEMVTADGATERAMPSAIWLRAEFATQRKRMWRGLAARSCSASRSQSPITAIS